MNLLTLLHLSMIVLGLMIIGLPLSLLWEMWHDEKELKKQGKLPHDW